MRVFSQGQLAQGLARMLVAAFMWSALFSGVAILPAGAQVVTRSATGQSVAVLPFQNLSGYCPDTFGQTASEAVSVELRDRLLLDVLPNPEVSLQMKNLGMAPPMGPEELVRLATELEVSMIVIGDVRAANLVVERGNRYAEVTLGVLLFDRVSEGFINGALVTARSPASLEVAGEDLIAKALKQAAFQGVQEMKTRPTITAMVLWSREGRIFTNTGTRGGVVVGMQMAAVRGGQRIAVVKITSTEPTGSYATVVTGSDLRTGDHLRALYDLPEVCPPNLKTRIKRESKSWERPVIIAGVLLGMASYATASRTLSEGDIAAPSFQVSNLANQLAYGSAFAYPLETANVLITWEPYQGTQKTRIAAYEIYRDGVLIEVLSRETQSTLYIDDDFFPPFGYIGTTWLNRTFTVNGATGNVGFNFTYLSWLPDEDGNPTFDEWYESLPFVAISYGTAVTDYGFIATPVVPGMRHVYQIRPLLIENHQLPDEVFANWEFIPADPQGYSSPDNYCTPVCPPATDQALVIGSVATYLFYGPLGADEMLLQVTRDTGDGTPPEFAPDRTLERVITGLDPMNPDLWLWQLQYTMQSIQVNLSEMQALPGTSDVYWWRVGARNRNDSLRARPLPANLTYEYGWVWSYPVKRLELSGAARAALTREQQDRLSMFRSNRVMKVRIRNDNRPLHVPR
jgi:hypothetical protein